MIINDKHKFCFIHIPKCAGTYVRNPLQQFDDTHGKFTKYVGVHEDLGMLDYVHIPLGILRKFFQREYECIKNYHSFTVIRDPFSRFPSSFSQRIKLYGDKSILVMSKKEIQKSVDEVINYLEKQKEVELLPYDYIHFQPQVSYVYDNDECLVNRVYLLEKVDKLIMDVSALVKQDLSIIVDNKHNYNNISTVYKSGWVKKSVSLFKPETRKKIRNVLPSNMVYAIKNAIYTPRDSKLRDVFESLHVKSFIEDYYKDDLEFYSSQLSSGD